MTAGANFFTLRMKARAENLGLARLAVAAFASQLDFTLQDVEEIKIAVNEAVTNAIIHAYPLVAVGAAGSGPASARSTGAGGTMGSRAFPPGGPGADPVVDLAARLDGGALHVTVSDYGIGIDDVEQAREPAYSTDPERMGMGFAFMEAFMDRVTVESEPGAGTVVHMMKRPAPAQQGGGSTP